MNTPDISDLYYSLPVIVDFNAYAKKNLIIGKIQTVKCLNDNSKVREVLSKDGTDSILIVDGHASKEVALMGDKVAVLAKENKWEAIIINGYIRDVEHLHNIDLGIYALGTSPKKSKKENMGEISVDIKLQGVDIKPGYWAYIDQNGIIISPEKLKINS
tara:strand:- start:1364 stop:1840 length:477 start_codon:yes stop_codon:yes gene_type:complete